MGKYRGADGWLHDDSVGKPQRYENKEDVKEPAKAPPKVPSEKKILTKCPNCDLKSSWLRLEGRCRNCRWTEGRPTEQPDPKQGPYAKCPNCDMESAWRRLEGHCLLCGWGIIQPAGNSEKSQPTGSSTTAPDSGTCCAALGSAIVTPLVGMGMGHAVGGFGGMLVGLGVGIAVIAALAVMGLSSSSTKEGSK